MPQVPLPPDCPKHAKSSLLHAIALAHLAITYVRGWCANSRIARVRLAAECDRMKAEMGLLREELRIKDARMASIPARERPYYPPTERMAILQLKAGRSWSNAQTARGFLLTAETIANWMKRVDEQGNAALVQVCQPVNRFPEFVTHLVKQLKLLCPTMGKVRIANTLARAGLHLGVSTVRRMLKRPAPCTPQLEAEAPKPARSGRTVIAKYPNHVWNVDLTIMPTSAGFWVPWSPLSVLQRWPFCWWIAVIVDHFSRLSIGFAVFTKEPTAEQVCKVLDRAVKRVGRAPKYTVTDQGAQFGFDGALNLIHPRRPSGSTLPVAWVAC